MKDKNTLKTKTFFLLRNFPKTYKKIMNAEYSLLLSERSRRSERSVAVEINSLILRLSNQPGPFPRISLISNESLLSRKRMYRECEYSLREYKNWNTHILSSLSTLSSLRNKVLLLYIKNETLRIYNFNSSIDTNVRIREKLFSLRVILNQSRDTLSQSQSQSDTEQVNVKNWWKKRFSLDHQLRDLLLSINYTIRENNLLISLDEELKEIPFEYTRMFEKKSVRRVISTEYLIHAHTQTQTELERVTQSETAQTAQTANERVTVTQTSQKETAQTVTQKETEIELVEFLVVKNNLKVKILVEKRLTQTLERVKKKILEIDPECDREKDLECDLECDLEQCDKSLDYLFFFGHGNGQSHLRNMKSKYTILLGCSSVRIVTRQNFREILNFSSNSRVIGTLWDVTDRDIDMFGLVFLSCVIEKLSVGECVRRGREAMRLRWLNGCICIYTSLTDL